MGAFEAEIRLADPNADGTDPKQLTRDNRSAEPSWGP